MGLRPAAAILRVELRRGHNNEDTITVSAAVTERAPAQCRRRTCSENGVGRCRDRNLPAVLRRLTAQISDLALQFIDEGQKAQAIPLLKRATIDNDFPEAAVVLQQMKAKSPYIPCRCRRLSNKKLRGHAKCLLHPR